MVSLQRAQRAGGLYPDAPCSFVWWPDTQYDDTQSHDPQPYGDGVRAMASRPINSDLSPLDAPAWCSPSLAVQLTIQYVDTLENLSPVWSVLFNSIQCMFLALVTQEWTSTKHQHMASPLPCDWWSRKGGVFFLFSICQISSNSLQGSSATDIPDLCRTFQSSSSSTINPSPEITTSLHIYSRASSSFFFFFVNLHIPAEITEPHAHRHAQTHTQKCPQSPALSRHLGQKKKTRHKPLKCC